MLITIEARFTVGIDLLMTIPQEQLRTYKKRYIKILRLFAFSSIAKDKTAANSVSTWPSSLTTVQMLKLRLPFIPIQRKLGNAELAYLVIFKQDFRWQLFSNDFSKDGVLCGTCTLRCFDLASHVWFSKVRWKDSRSDHLLYSGVI